MARSKSNSASQHVEPEDGSRGGAEPDARGRDGEPATTKADAARAALSAGHESPADAVAFIKSRFGIEIGRQHFSAVKSQLKKKDRESSPRARAGRPPATPKRPEAGPPGLPASGEADLLDALESIKPLIARYGPDQVKRIVDLLV